MRATLFRPRRHHQTSSASCSLPTSSGASGRPPREARVAHGEEELRWWWKSFLGEMVPSLSVGAWIVDSRGSKASSATSPPVLADSPTSAKRPRTSSVVSRAVTPSASTSSAARGSQNAPSSESAGSSSARGSGTTTTLMVIFGQSEVDKRLLRRRAASRSPRSEPEGLGSPLPLSPAKLEIQARGLFSRDVNSTQLRTLLVTPLVIALPAPLDLISSSPKFPIVSCHNTHFAL